MADTVRAARDGDLDAFDALVRAWQRAVTAIAWSRTGDDQVAREVAQEVFLDAWRELSMLREPGAFPAWIRRIAIKHADRVTRRRRPRSVALDDRLAGAEPGPEVLATEAERAARVRRAVQALTPIHRETLLLSLSGAGHEEVAAALAVPVSTVKKRLHDARRHIRPYLLEELDMDPLIPTDDRLPDLVRAFIAARTGRAGTLAAMLDARPDLLGAVEPADPATTAATYLPPTGRTTLLAEAVLHGHASVVDLLLDRGATGDVLGAAVVLGHEAVVDRLLARGADPDPRDWHGGTPLAVAALRGRADLVARLLRAGADPSIANRFGWTARRWAEHHGHAAVGRVLDGGEPGDAPIGGRIVDPSGRPLDGGPPIAIPARPEGVVARRETGIKAVDLLCPLVPGVHELAAGPWVGKTVLLGELMGGPAVVAGFVDRTFEVRDLEHALRELGVWGAGAVLCLATDEAGGPALAHAALALAESRGMLLVADDRIGDALHALAPRVPVVAFGPHVHPEPVARPRWGGRIVLDPVRARSASYPAVDPVHTAGVGFSSDRHRALAERVRAAVRAGGPVAERIEAFLTQPFRSAEPFLGRPGVSVALRDTLDGVERLLDGDVPQGSLRYVGSLADAGSWPVAEGAPF